MSAEDSYDGKKNKKRNTAIIALATAMLLTTIGVIGKTKAGRPIQNLGLNISNFFSKKADEMNNPLIRGFFEGISRVFGFIGSVLKNTFPNANNAKDSLAKKFYRMNNPFSRFLAKFDEATSGLYKHLGKQTLNSKYTKTQKLFDKADDLILNALEKRAKEASGDAELLKQIDAAKKLVQDRKISLQELIGMTKRTNAKGKEIFEAAKFSGRLAKLENDWVSLDERAWKKIVEEVKPDPKTDGKISNFFTKFICEEMVAPEKAAFQRGIYGTKNLITNDLNDVYKSLNSEVSTLRSMIDLKDHESWKALIGLEKALRRTNKSIDHGEISKAASALKECVSKTQKNGADEAINKTFESFERILQKNKAGDKGCTEELYSVLKRILPPEVCKGEIADATEKAKKAITKAVNAEGNDLFDKMRDIQTGGAPTDFFTLIASTAGMGVYLAQADTKEERVSGGLTLGIPLITALATSMTMAAKMVSGAYAMVVSGIAGLAANIVGTSVDKIYKKSRNVDESTYTLPGLQDIQKELPEAFRAVVPDVLDTQKPAP